MLELTYSEFIEVIGAGVLLHRYVELSNKYILFAEDGAVLFKCVIYKNTEDSADYEANYKNTASTLLVDTDSAGRRVSRVAATKKGWRYLAHVLEIETSKLNSVYSKDWQLQDTAGVSLKFYDANDLELVNGTQTELDTSCVKTKVTISPDYDYDIIGGNLHQVTSPSEDVRLWVIAGAPELGAAGVKEFVGGLNLRFMGADEQIQTDGRASARMVKITEGVPYNTNQLQYIIRHPAGFNHKLMIVVEYFRA